MRIGAVGERPPHRIPERASDDHLGPPLDHHVDGGADDDLAGPEGTPAAPGPGRPRSVHDPRAGGPGHLGPGRTAGRGRPGRVRDGTGAPGWRAAGGHRLDGHPSPLGPALLGVEEPGRWAVPVHRADRARPGHDAGRRLQRRLPDERGRGRLLHRGTHRRPAGRRGRLARHRRRRVGHRRGLGERRVHDARRRRRAAEPGPPRRRGPAHGPGDEPRLAGVGGHVRGDVVRVERPRDREPVAIRCRRHRGRRAGVRGRPGPHPLPAGRPRGAGGDRPGDAARHQPQLARLRHLRPVAGETAPPRRPTGAACSRAACRARRPSSTRPGRGTS